MGTVMLMKIEKKRVDGVVREEAVRRGRVREEDFGLSWVMVQIRMEGV